MSQRDSQCVMCCYAGMWGFHCEWTNLSSEQSILRHFLALICNSLLSRHVSLIFFFFELTESIWTCLNHSEWHCRKQTAHVTDERGSADHQWLNKRGHMFIQFTCKFILENASRVQTGLTGVQNAQSINYECVKLADDYTQLEWRQLQA